LEESVSDNTVHRYSPRRALLLLTVRTGRTGEPRLWRSPRSGLARLLPPAAPSYCATALCIACTCAPTPNRLTTKADRAFHVGMANVKQPRHDNLKARCFAKPQGLSEDSYILRAQCPAALHGVPFCAPPSSLRPPLLPPRLPSRHLSPGCGRLGTQRESSVSSRGSCL